MYPTAKTRSFLTFPRLSCVAATAVALLMAGCAGASKQSSGKTVDALPDDPNALVLGAEVALQRGQYLEASRAYVKAAQGANDETLAEQATRIAYEHHQWTLVLTGAERWLELNAEYAAIWPNITVKREPPADAKEFDGVPGKFERYFSPNPGSGDEAEEKPQAAAHQSQSG